MTRTWGKQSNPRSMTGRSPAAAAYQKWYKTAHWQRMRAAQLKREPYCAFCLKAGRQTPATIADHIVPHRGDRQKFDDMSNLQSLCSIHHNQKIAMEDGKPARQVIGPDGWPVFERGK